MVEPCHARQSMRKVVQSLSLLWLVSTREKRESWFTRAAKRTESIASCLVDWSQPTLQNGGTTFFCVYGNACRDRTQENVELFKLLAECVGQASAWVRARRLAESFLGLPEPTCRAFVRSGRVIVFVLVSASVAQSINGFCVLEDTWTSPHGRALPRAPHKRYLRVPVEVCQEFL